MCEPIYRLSISVPDFLLFVFVSVENSRKTRNLWPQGWRRLNTRPSPYRQVPANSGFCIDCQRKCDEACICIENMLIFISLPLYGYFSKRTWCNNAQWKTASQVTSDQQAKHKQLTTENLLKWGFFFLVPSLLWLCKKMQFFCFSK